VFLEHVFWVVSLNSLFILIFAFCPYHIGHFTLSGFTVKHVVNGINFEVSAREPGTAIGGVGSTDSWF
jgi:E3 ubiquitin-protein ligase MARCH6